MPRPKKPVEQRTRLTDILKAKHQKKFGDDSITTSAGLSDITDWISTRIFALDTAIGRPGIPLGRLTTLQGKEASGKTSITCSILAETQSRGGLAIYIDAENKFDRAFAAKLGLYDEEEVEARGLDVLPLLIVQPEHIGNVFQQIHKLIEDAREEDPNILICIAWDSVAATPTTAEFEADYDSTQPGLASRQVSAGLRKLCRVIAKERVALIAINQEKEAIGKMGWGGANIATIAQKPLGFHSSLRLEVTKTGYIGDKEENATGIKIRVKVAKNQVAPYGRRANFEFHNIGRVGIDNDGSILDMGLDLGIVKKAGSWLHMKGSDEKFYRKDFAKSNDYDAIQTAVKKAVADKLDEMLGGWSPDVEGEGEAEEDERFGPVPAPLEEEEDE